MPIVDGSTPLDAAHLGLVAATQNNVNINIKSCVIKLTAGAPTIDTDANNPNIEGFAVSVNQDPDDVYEIAFSPVFTARPCVVATFQNSSTNSTTPVKRIVQLLTDSTADYPDKIRFCVMDETGTLAVNVTGYINIIAIGSIG